jgi:hypothetical protein
VHLLQLPRREDAGGSRDRGRNAENIENAHPRGVVDIALQRVDHPGAVDALILRERHVRDHVECGCGHMFDHVGRPPDGHRQPLRRRLCSAGHDRGQRIDAAGRKRRRRGASLPAPVVALGQEQAVADGRLQDGTGGDGFGIVLHCF